MNKFRTGFTLIELLVVVSIISVLSTTVLATLNGARAKAQKAVVIQTILEYRKAVLYAHDELGKFPEVVPGFPSSTCIGTFPDGLCGWNNTNVPNAGVNALFSNYIPGLPTITAKNNAGSIWEGPIYSCYAINPNNGQCLARLEWFLEGAFQPCGIAESSGIYAGFSVQNISYCLLFIR